MRKIKTLWNDTIEFYKYYYSFLKKHWFAYIVAPWLLAVTVCIVWDRIETKRLNY